METNIIGRVEEKQILCRILNSGNPEFVAVYGRRRIGKTFLITEYFEDRCVLFEITGSPKATNADNLTRFGAEISEKFHGRTKIINPQSWEDAFKALREAVDVYLSENPDGKIILFFDELPWLDKKKSGFLGTLDFYWNRYYSKKRYGRVKVIICGSAASWMIKKVIKNKGGLHNRITQKIDLRPFSLAEVEAYLLSRNIRLERKQILELYMAFGGVPFYLTFIQKAKSIRQLINELCFTKGGFLYDEFDNLFASLFERYVNHEKIVRTLAKSRSGYVRNEIASQTGLPNSGELTTYLRELEQSGFIARVPFWGRKSKGSIYRLHDEYILFYFKWIEPVKTRMEKSIPQSYWMQQANTQSWNAWAGFAFEDICFKHIGEIRKALGISGIVTYCSSWHTRGRTDIEGEGAQIDLLIERSDRAINICEIKFSSDIFEISAKYKQEIERKAAVFRRLTNTRHQLFITLITTYGAKQNDAYIACIDNQITADALFAV